jgi:hypothetical protein
MREKRTLIFVPGHAKSSQKGRKRKHVNQRSRLNMPENGEMNGRSLVIV